MWLLVDCAYSMEVLYPYQQAARIVNEFTNRKDMRVEEGPVRGVPWEIRGRLGVNMIMHETVNE